jgi:hypothetical protein
MFVIYLWDPLSNQSCIEYVRGHSIYRKSKRERARLIREACAIYDSIFSPAEPVNDERNKPSASHTAGGANVCRDPGGYNSHGTRASSGELRGTVDHRSGAMGKSAMLSFPVRERALGGVNPCCLNLRNAGSR